MTASFLNRLIIRSVSFCCFWLIFLSNNGFKRFFDFRIFKVFLPNAACQRVSGGSAPWLPVDLYSAKFISVENVFPFDVISFAIFFTFLSKSSVNIRTFSFLLTLRFVLKMFDMVLIYVFCFAVVFSSLLYIIFSISTSILTIL